MDELLEFAASLPSPVALVISEYAEESRPFIKLHRLIDAAELITRFFCVSVLSDVQAQFRGIPPDLQKTLSTMLPQPTFGGWKEMVTRALERKGYHPFLVGLPEVWKDHWRPLLGTNNKSRRACILPLRNYMAHIGRLTDAAAEDLLKDHQRPFEEALEKLDFLRNYQMFAVGDADTVRLLRGNPAAVEAIPASAVVPQLEGAGVFLVHEGRSLRLFPLHLWDMVRPHATGRDVVSYPAPLLYFRYLEGQEVEYTVLGGEVCFAQREDVVEAFSDSFRLSTWRREHEEVEWRKQVLNELDIKFKRFGYYFDDIEEHFRDLRALYGRQDYLREAQKWIAGHEEQGGTLWVGGQPGVGKSAFMVGLRNP